MPYNMTTTLPFPPIFYFHLFPIIPSFLTLPKSILLLPPLLYSEGYRWSGIFNKLHAVPITQQKVSMC